MLTGRGPLGCTFCDVDHRHFKGRRDFVRKRNLGSGSDERRGTARPIRSTTGRGSACQICSRMPFRGEGRSPALGRRARYST